MNPELCSVGVWVARQEYGTMRAYRQQLWCRKRGSNKLAGSAMRESYACCCKPWSLCVCVNKVCVCRMSNMSTMRIIGGTTSERSCMCVCAGVCVCVCMWQKCGSHVVLTPECPLSIQAPLQVVAVYPTNHIVIRYRCRHARPVAVFNPGRPFYTPTAQPKLYGDRTRQERDGIVGWAACAMGSAVVEGRTGMW